MNFIMEKFLEILEALHSDSLITFADFHPKIHQRGDYKRIDLISYLIRENFAPKKEIIWAFQHIVRMKMDKMIERTLEKNRDLKWSNLFS